MEEREETSKSKVLAIKILGNRRLSAAEIKKRLIQKGTGEETAEETTGWLEKMGMINDPEYAGLIVSHYIAKGYGVTRIKDELYKRGIPREMWDEVLESLNEEEVQDAATAFLEKKLKGDYSLTEIKRASDALIRRGFNYEQAKTAIKKYAESIEIIYEHE
jgi:regulatory protein